MVLDFTPSDDSSDAGGFLDESTVDGLMEDLLVDWGMYWKQVCTRGVELEDASKKAVGYKRLAEAIS